MGLHDNSGLEKHMRDEIQNRPLKDSVARKKTEDKAIGKPGPSTAAFCTYMGNPFPESIHESG
jgi:hypothetical protein